MADSYYTIGSTSPYVGQTLNQINAAGANNTPGYQGIGFNPADFAKYLGISADTPLTANQQLTYNGGASQGDTNMIGRLFSPQTAAERDQSIAQQNNDLMIKQNQPAINQLQSAIGNTQGAYGSAVSQYQSEIPNIQNIYQDTINKLTKATNSEYAARGVPTTSFSAIQNLANTIQPTQNQESNAVNQFLNSIAGLQTGGAAAVSNLQQLLGGLQSGNPLASLQTSITQAQQPYQQASAQAQAALLGAQTQAQNYQSKYVTIPGVGVLDATTGQLISQYGVSNPGGLLTYTGGK